MKTTLFFLATLTIIILLSCTEELDFKIHEFKNRGLHAKDFALIALTPYKLDYFQRG